MPATLRNRRVLVTGGAGFIGSFLTEHLAECGADVVVADNFSRGKAENIAGVSDTIDVRHVDLTTHKGCVEATADVDDVFHLAAAVGGIHYIERENVGGLTPSVLMNQLMLEAAHQNDVERFLFASSACLYPQDGGGLNLFSEEDGRPANPGNTYGWAKVLGEVACEAYHTDTELQTGAVRIFNCYGTRERLDPASSHVIPSLCRKVVETQSGGSIDVFGDGTQERGFIYVTDVVDGLCHAIERKTDGKPINLGNSTEVVSITELAERIISISDKELDIEYDQSMPTGTDKYAADMTRMRTELHWEPTVSLDDGLTRVYEWVKAELEDRQPLPPASETQS